MGSFGPPKKVRQKARQKSCRRQIKEDNILYKLLPTVHYFLWQLVKCGKEITCLITINFVCLLTSVSFNIWSINQCFVILLNLFLVYKGDNSKPNKTKLISLSILNYHLSNN